MEFEECLDKKTVEFEVLETIEMKKDKNIFLPLPNVYAGFKSGDENHNNLLSTLTKHVMQQDQQTFSSPPPF